MLAAAVVRRCLDKIASSIACNLVVLDSPLLALNIHLPALGSLVILLTRKAELSLRNRQLGITRLPKTIYKKLLYLRRAPDAKLELMTEYTGTIMRKILIATTNHNKVSRIKRLLVDVPVEIVSLADLPTELPGTCRDSWVWD